VQVKKLLTATAGRKTGVGDNMTGGVGVGGAPADSAGVGSVIQSGTGGASAGAAPATSGISSDHSDPQKRGRDDDDADAPGTKKSKPKSTAAMTAAAAEASARAVEARYATSGADSVDPTTKVRRCSLTSHRPGLTAPGFSS